MLILVEQLKRLQEVNEGNESFHKEKEELKRGSSII